MQQKSIHDYQQPHFDKVKEAVEYFLKNFEEYRPVQSRERLTYRVREFLPNAKMVTVDRTARWFQNKMGMYRPPVEDGRHQFERNYREYFGGDESV